MQHVFSLDDAKLYHGGIPPNNLRKAQQERLARLGGARTILLFVEGRLSSTEDKSEDVFNLAIEMLKNGNKYVQVRA